MSRLLFLLLYISACTVNQTHAYITSTALWQKESQHVLVIGDLHHKGFEDMCHRDYLETLFDSLADRPYTIDVILEHATKEHIERSHHLFCIQQASRYAYAHNLRHKSLAFKLSDIRRDMPALREIHNVGTLLKSFGHHEQIYYAEFIQHIPIDTFLAAINSIQDMINKLIAQSNENKTFKDFFTSLSNKLQEDITKLEQFFKNHNQEAALTFDGKTITFPAGTVAAAFLQAAQSYNYASEKLEYLYNTYLKTLYEELVDVAYASNLIQSQKEKHDTIVYVGQGHAVILNKLLSQLGYTLTSQEGPALTTLSEKEYKPIQLDHLRQTFDRFKRPILPSDIFVKKVTITI